LNFEFSRSPRFWLVSLILWAVTLYTLSSFSKTMPEGGPEIPHIDKVLHFGYFFGGGIIFATWILIWKGTSSKFVFRIAIPLAILACIGALDEYHQTFTPGRSGNDPFDWLADVLGSAAGLFIANRFHPLYLKFSSR
jgi:VanZ family protein|tara:strand:- start:2039 stop:2449 length:411 start_codon:yes stop_codon:yes gene_type:complete